MFFLAIILLALIDGVDARGRKKKKRPSVGSSGPTCASLGLDCSETCCAGSECAESKLDCATPFQRPFIELYIGFGTILGITICVSTIICVGNFCLQFKFCQHYDEGSDMYIGGCSICDMLSCLLSCGLSLREGANQSNQTAGIETDFRKRFEMSMDKDRQLEGKGKKRKSEKKGKNVKNYLSQTAKQKELYQSEMENIEDGTGQRIGSRHGKCHQFCCIVFCCVDP